jgi:mersacidin/lichenicidin family type 2 lantibiotic
VHRHGDLLALSARQLRLSRTRRGPPPATGGDPRHPGADWSAPAASKEISMKKLDIARAWTDEDYYLGLTETERAGLPANPAAAITVSAESLRFVNGAITTSVAASCHGTVICTPCPHYACD